MFDTFAICPVDCIYLWVDKQSLVVLTQLLTSQNNLFTDFMH